MNRKQFSKAFTLVEMLIVIVIIGILATALVPRLLSVQERARDTRRKLDMKVIYNANEMYLLDNNDYVSTGNNYRSTSPQPWLIGLSGYLTSIPIDPINIGTAPTTSGHYLYNYYGLTTGTVKTYSLETRLESPRDPDRCAAKSYVYRNVWSQAYLWINCNPPYTQRYLYDISNVRNWQF